MFLKSYFKKIVLKLATNGQRDKGFLFTSTFVPKELSAPALELYTCIKALKYILGRVSDEVVSWFSIISTEIPLNFLSRRSSYLCQQLMTGIILVMNGNVTKSYRKLMYGQINDTKHTKTFISRPFGNFLDLRFVCNLYIFLPKEHESVGKKTFFRSEAEKKTFSHRF